ncbi:hypothetical protein GCM10010869_03300 [Mesorhizobium tianshanense]|uniref:Y4mF family transcriptional regulator n=1 Tax=Mesorhizobium tianshanense TaxID=39844 RepID=A0A562PC74_9HYPH|nr:helix-turn-helix transcriptional regulator [Mesorhizobium tianshanense]TWI41933.1 y4mF family transcriptional regulator [Mesorhizobium tianshanense]GLS34742.1 hypothetical protein GCM10010869_03300 [Mesorhizobium tianshanense]
MEKKESKSATSVVNAKDLGKLAAQAGSTQDLARQIAAIAAPSSALSQTAAEIARILSSHNTLGDLAKNRAVSLPKVNLNLPDISRTIQASLPRSLSDTHLPRRKQNVAVVEDAVQQPEVNVSKIEPVELEIATPENLGLLIRRAREGRNLSQQSFADLAGVGRRFVSELENGKATLELGKVLKVARAAGISIFARSR